MASSSNTSGNNPPAAGPSSSAPNREHAVGMDLLDFTCDYCKQLKEKPPHSPSCPEGGLPNNGIIAQQEAPPQVSSQSSSPVESVTTATLRPICFRCTNLMYNEIKGLIGRNVGGKDGVIPSPINFVGEEGRYAEDIRKQNENGETILHEAVRRADKDMVEWLMLVDSKLALVPMEGTSPLYLAVSLGYHDIATMIHTQSNGFVSYSGPNGQNVLHASVLRSEGIVLGASLFGTNISTSRLLGSELRYLHLDF
ncbi:hypothetical protein OsJ_28907 [Oryza sativa Japonica Group]|uniref:Uncharacterized protein n=1 Tax=Oryza sativa subsp. japonica TaxID=39947 RepID=B9G2Y5_ORYSJ|nr:hypothetical protein OsJ_28907 [Oryza sativa Japonica Group]